MNRFYEYLNELDVYFFVCLVGIVYIIFLLGMTAWSASKKDAKKPLMKECANCGPGASNFLVPSMHDGSKKICPDCADKEWENHLQGA